jgi:hypothetical protein
VKGHNVRTLEISPFDEPIRRQDQPAIIEEGLRLLAFLAPGERHRVRFGPVTLTTTR